MEELADLFLKEVRLTIPWYKRLVIPFICCLFLTIGIVKLFIRYIFKNNKKED